MNENINFESSINDTENYDYQAHKKAQSSFSCKQFFMFSITIITLILVFYCSLECILPRYVTFTSIIQPVTDTKLYEITSLSNQLTITLISYPILTYGYGEMLINSGFSNLSLFDLPHLTKLSLKQHSIELEMTEKHTLYKFYSSNSNWKRDIESFASLFSHLNFSNFDIEKEVQIISNLMNSSCSNDAITEDLLIDNLLSNRPKKNSSPKLLSVNNKSLLDNLQNKTYDYYRENYNGNNMNLILISNMSLNEMKNIAIRNFTNINRNKPSELHKEYISNDLIVNEPLPLNKIVFKYNSIPQEKLSFIFIFKDRNNAYMYKSIKFIAYLLIKGKTTFFESMKSRDHITSFKTDIKTRSSNDNIKYIKLILNIELTKEGFMNSNEVIAYVFKYIHYIQNEIKEEYYNEYQLQMNNTFNYSENSNIQSLLDNIAINVFTLKNNLANILYEEYSLSQYNHTLIQSVFDQLTPENLIILMNIPKSTRIKEIESSMSRLVNCTFANEFELKTYTHINTSYYISTFNTFTMDKHISDINSTMFNPFELNKYINEITDVNSIIQSNQSLLYDYNTTTLFEKEIIKMWYKYDNTFATSKSYFYFKLLLSSIAESNQEQYYHMLLFYCELKTNIDISLNQITQAGNSIEITIEDNGILISIDAYTELIEIIVEKLIDQLLKVKITKKNIQYLISQANYIYEKQLNSDLFRRLIKNKVNMNINKLLLNQINPNNVQQTIKSNLSKGLIVGLAYGRLCTNVVQRIIAFILPHFTRMNHKRDSSNEEYINKVTIHMIFKESFILRQLSSESNFHSLVNHYEIKFHSLKSKALGILTLSFINSHMNWNFTKCSIGNTLRFRLENIDEYSYFIININSIQCNPKELNQYIDEQLNYVYNIIHDMTSEIYSLHINNEINLLPIPLSIQNKSRIVWNAIDNNTTDLISSHLFKNIIDNITQTELIDFYKEVFYSSVNKLSIQTFSSLLGAWDELMNETIEIYSLNYEITLKIINDIAKLSQYFI